MINPIRYYYKIHLSRFYVTFLSFLLVASIVSCTAPRPRTNTKDQSLVYLEKEITDSNKKIEEIYHRVSVIQFMVDNHEKAIRDMERMAQPGKIKKSTLPTTTSATSQAAMVPESTKSAEQTYNFARKEYNTQNYEKASALFNSFIQKYPTHDLSDNAIYWNGESFYAQKKYASAIKQFQNLITNYPNGSKVPDALLKTGYSFLSIKDPDNARKYLKKVTRNYPFSPAASKAAEMLKKIQSK